MAYPFHIEEADLSAVRDGLRLAVERPQLYNIRVNGRLCDFRDAPRWFDEDIASAPIHDLVCPGENVIEMECQPFHALAEIMPVYLLGNFSLRSETPGFVAIRAQPLGLGDWTRMGRPFDPQGLRYRFAFELTKPISSSRLTFPQVAASRVGVRVDGQTFGETFREPWQVEVRIDLGPGRHELEVTVYGNLKNLMGPHHWDGLPGPWSWEASPPVQPDGQDYRRETSGLLAVPVLRI